MHFLFLKMVFQNHVYDSVTWNREKGTPAIDTVHMAVLVWDYIILVFCPTSSLENLSRFMAIHTDISASCLAIRN